MLIIMQKRTFLNIVVLFILLTASCDLEIKSIQGKLFIIGGGDRPEAMMKELVDLAGVRENGYMFILPMASSVPDSSLMWARDDFNKAGVKFIYGYNFQPGETTPKEKLDSLQNASLIYICGGDQSRFMSVVLNTPVMDAIQKAYRNGGVIAGTSAGAAVMSKKMITGNQKKHPSEETGFPTIESGNIELKEGLGLLPEVIIDQHFIKRQRLNRLISVSIENPMDLCVGIDESTALVVEGKYARVTGEGQVVVIRNHGGGKLEENGLLGVQDLRLSIYLQDQSFRLSL